MRQSMLDGNVAGVVMPRIGCGLDRLEWSKVLPMIEQIFDGTSIQVIICAR